MTSPLEEQKLAAERTRHTGEPRRVPAEPVESREERERRDVERPSRRVERERP